MSAAQIVINDDLLITIMIAGFSFLVSACGALIVILGRMLFNKLDKKIDQCSQDLSERMDYKFIALDAKMQTIIEYNKETRKSAYDGHNRITSHVEKHHTG